MRMCRSIIATLPPRQPYSWILMVTMWMGQAGTGTALLIVALRAWVPVKLHGHLLWVLDITEIKPYGTMEPTPIAVPTCRMTLGLLQALPMASVTGRMTILIRQPVQQLLLL